MKMRFNKVPKLAASSAMQGESFDGKSTDKVTKGLTKTDIRNWRNS